MSEVKSSPDQATSEPFATPELFREYLTLDDLSDLIDPELFEVNYGHLSPDQQPATLGDIIQLAEDEGFYAECAYLNHWCAELDHDPEENGIDFDYRPLSTNGQTIDGAEIYIAYQGEHEIFFQYRLNPVLPGYQLQIIDSEGNVVYWREPGQDPYTEWTINCMADDPEYVNADGEIDIWYDSLPKRIDVLVEILRDRCPLAIIATLEYQRDIITDRSKSYK